MIRSAGQNFRAVLQHYMRMAGVFFRGTVIWATMMTVVLLFLSTIDGILNGNVYINYQLGCGMINYAAGFVRRGLFGEILMLMNAVCQPVLSMILLSSVSFLFILYISVSRMIKLKAGLPYILALMLSPSLLLMHTGAEFLRTDGIVFALNLSASCIILHRLFGRNKLSLIGGQGVFCRNDRHGRNSYPAALIVRAYSLDVRSPPASRNVAVFHLRAKKSPDNALPAGIQPAHRYLYCHDEVILLCRQRNHRRIMGRNLRQSGFIQVQ